MGTSPRYRWQPTTSEVALRYGLSESDVVRFDHNTSPYPSDWAPGIVAPMARHLNEYPGASYMPLRLAIARYIDAEPDNIVVGAGIDELIQLVAKAFLGPGTRAIAALPTYPLYEIATLQHHGEFMGIPYTNGFAFPEDGVSRMAETSDVAWLCVPNNPTGERIPDSAISRIIRDARGLVVIDAAYAEFASDRWARWVDAHSNVIVLQTMSKAFGLAALRVGYAIASPELTALIDAVRPPGSISTLSERLARSALDEPSRMERFVRYVHKERTPFAGMLEHAGLTAYQSDTNFVLCHVGQRARDLADSLMTKGLVVRSYPEGHPLEDHLRFTVRARGENELLIDAISTIYPRLVDGSRT